MPIYVYQHDTPPPAGCPSRFERIESIRAEALAICPTCSQPVHRVPARFAHGRDVLSTSNIKDKGFTRLRRRDKGVYEAD